MKKPKKWSLEWYKQFSTNEELMKAMIETVHEGDDKKKPKKKLTKKPPKES